MLGRTWAGEKGGAHSSSSSMHPGLTGDLARRSREPSGAGTAAYCLELGSIGITSRPPERNEEGELLLSPLRKFLRMISIRSPDNRDRA